MYSTCSRLLETHLNTLLLNNSPLAISLYAQDISYTRVLTAFYVLQKNAAQDGKQTRQGSQSQYFKVFMHITVYITQI